MSELDQVVVAAVQTPEGERFAMFSKDAILHRKPWTLLTEGELRTGLEHVGLAEEIIEAKIQLARKWVSTLTRRN